MWFRVFGTSTVQPEPAALLQHLRDLGLEVPGNFGGDEHGWFHADFAYTGSTQPLRLDRYLDSEEEIRDQLNAWAAWLETQDNQPNAPRLMQHMVGTKQVFTLRCPRDAADEANVLKLCEGICRFLAEKTKGVYQIDMRGFYGPEGGLLLTEAPLEP